MGLLEKIKDRFRGRQEIVEKVADAEEQFVPANRMMRRTAMHYERKRGAGWTRPMRKGRTKRHA